MFDPKEKHWREKKSEQNKGGVYASLNPGEKTEEKANSKAPRERNKPKNLAQLGDIWRMAQEKPILKRNNRSRKNRGGSGRATGKDKGGSDRGPKASGGNLHKRPRKKKQRR